MLDFLPDRLAAALRNVNRNFVYELRVRTGKPIVLNFGGRYTYLAAAGMTDRQGAALVAQPADIDEIVCRVSEFSLYSVTEQLRRGFLTGAQGERIGLAGTYVYDNGAVFTVKDIASLNIRVPHAVLGCGEAIYRTCLAARPANVLLLSAPGRGKTTILRDLARLFSLGAPINVLISDERNEITAGGALDAGAFSDVIRYARKQDALTAAVRAMRPDVIITDELVSKEELDAVSTCIRGGVAVLASAHLRDLNALCSDKIFAEAAAARLFDYYVVLRTEGVGVVDGIYGSDLSPIAGAIAC